VANLCVIEPDRSTPRAGPRAGAPARGLVCGCGTEAAAGSDVGGWTASASGFWPAEPVHPPPSAGGLLQLANTLYGTPPAALAIAGRQLTAWAQHPEPRRDKALLARAAWRPCARWCSGACMIALEWRRCAALPGGARRRGPADSRREARVGRLSGVDPDALALALRW